MSKLMVRILKLQLKVDLPNCLASWSPAWITFRNHSLLEAETHSLQKRTYSINIYKDPHLWGFSSRSIFHLPRLVQPQVLATTRSPLSVDTDDYPVDFSRRKKPYTLEYQHGSWKWWFGLWTMIFPFPLGDFDQVPDVHFPGGLAKQGH